MTVLCCVLSSFADLGNLRYKCHHWPKRLVLAFEVRDAGSRCGAAHGAHEKRCLVCVRKTDAMLRTNAHQISTLSFTYDKS
jgi:hypothetical protein